MPPIRPSSESETSNNPTWRLGPESVGGEDEFLLSVATRRPEFLPTEIDDAERLLARIAEHGLMGRCRRLRAAIEARGYPGNLMTGIDALYQKTEREHFRNMAAVEAACRVLGDGLGVMIKGSSCFLLTGDDATLRCGDIDLVVPEGDPVVAHLLSEGFERTRAPFMHEIGELALNGVEFDLQRGFPVNRYPQGEPEISGQAVSPWGIAQTCEIGFADLARARVAVPVSGGRLWIPTFEMAVLIAAAHAFMNYTNIWSISHRQKTWLRLAELADIREMTFAPEFSRERFAGLAERFHAHDVLAWTDWIWTRLGCSPVLGSTGQRTDFPLNLWWNLWVTLRPEIDALLSSHWYPLRELSLQILHAYRNLLSARSGEWCKLEPLWEAPDRKRRIQVTARRSKERLEVAFNGLSRGALLRLRIETPGLAEELALPVETGAKCALGASAWGLVDASEASLSVVVDRAAWQHGAGFLGAMIEEGGDCVVTTLAPLSDE